MGAQTDIIQPPLYPVIHNKKEKIYIVAIMRKEKLNRKSLELMVTTKDSTHVSKERFLK